MAILNAGDTPGESELSHGSGIAPSGKQRAQLPNAAGDDEYSAYERLRFDHLAYTEENSIDPEFTIDPDHYSTEA